MQKGLHAVHFHVDQLHFDVTYRQFVLRAAACRAWVIPQFPVNVTGQIDFRAGGAKFGALQDYLVEQTEAAMADGWRAAWTMVQPLQLLSHSNEYPALCAVWEELTEELPLFVLCSFNVTAIGRDQAQHELERHSGYYAGGWFCTAHNLATNPEPLDDCARDWSQASTIAELKTSPESRCG